ncbi:MAG: glycosyltransferase [Anaerolineales bacterium]|jgi:GT2 family glycosyltransferase
MSGKSTSDMFDAYYFGHSCGRPYKRDDHWLGFFNTIADRIVEIIQPRTVLDAGCAMGFLVEALRDRGVQAWGFDVSEYAIANVHESIKPYCWVGSVLDPFPQKYDLIVCIEVLEHLHQSESERALVNLCQHTDDILFSSTPLDYKESTHFNVQPPEYWTELFARKGFLRDVDFDASFITPWAVRLRQVKEPLARIIRDYERRFWLLWKENTDLRSSVMELEGQLANSEQVIQLKERAIEAQVEAVMDRDRQIQGKEKQIQELNGQARALEGEIHSILNSRSWQIMQRVHRIRYRLFPLGSRRERWMYAIMRALSIFRQHGPKALINRTVWKARSGEPLAPTQPTIEKRSYTSWIAENDPHLEELELQRESVQNFSSLPSISIITPVYNPPPEVLRSTLDSVLNQTYEYWELCIVDGNSNDPEVRKILEAYVENYPRVRCRFLEENLGISGNTNVALYMAQGEYVAFLDHDDLLAPNMLYEVVQRLNDKPDTDLLYFDEDKVSTEGKRQDPFFKPDWSPEMLLSANYLTHPVIRRSLVNEVGGFDPDMDGTQDWDLVLRCTEKTNKIEHIPKVLYHWRQVTGSAATRFDAKSYVFDRQLKCIENHLQRMGINDAKATFDSPGFVRVFWSNSGEKVSIIIPTRDKVEYLTKCVDSILKLTKYPSYEILVIDNQSQDSQTFAYYGEISKLERVRVVEYDQEFNYSAANNFGANHATGKYLLFLNNDIEVLASDWLDELVRWAERPKIGAVGAKLLYPDGKIQHAGVVVGMEGHASHVFWGAVEKQGGVFGSVDWYRNYMAVTGACMMVPNDVFKRVGGFNEEYVLTFSDVEICVRMIEMGYRVVYNPYVRLRHYEGRSRGDHIPAVDIRKGYDNLRDLVEAGDPYFNPNLSYSVRIPMLKLENEEGRADRLERIYKRVAI